MSNVIAFPTAAERGLVAVERAVAAFSAGHTAQAIETMMRLAFEPNPLPVRELAARSLYELCNVRAADAAGRPLFEPECLFEPATA